MFKKGQKVVVVGVRSNNIDPLCITYPKNGGIYTYDKPVSFLGPDFYRFSILEEFPEDAIHNKHLRPLEDLLNEQSETDLKEIEKTFPELMPV